ncbi:hypothetical protein BRD00_08065 [Halobacteriales archaeon QS_8_69_26]|nr:MAG: hypothetical protein BRD00_08065 [Halobacteriales archaeon QS_8_69_26]
MGLLEVALSLFAVLTAAGALFVAGVAVAVNYDALLRKAIYHAYDPKVEVTLQDAGPETEKQFHITESGFEPTYDDDFEIDYHRFDNRVTAADGGGMIRTFTFSVNVDGYDHRAADVALDVTADSMVRLSFEDHHRNDVEDGYREIRMGSKREYSFMELPVSTEEPHWFNPTFEVQMPPDGTYREFEVEATVDVSMDASEFEVPVAGVSLPSSVGDVEFDSIEREWTIIGPDHPEFGS